MIHEEQLWETERLGREVYQHVGITHYSTSRYLYQEQNHKVDKPITLELLLPLTKIRFRKKIHQILASGLSMHSKSTYASYGFSMCFTDTVGSDLIASHHQQTKLNLAYQAQFMYDLYTI